MGNIDRELPLEDWLFAGQYGLGDWGAHVHGWLKNTERDLLLLRYEDLYSDTITCLQKICDFAAVNASESVLQNSVSDAAFTRMKRENEQEKRKNRKRKAGQDLSLPRVSTVKVRSVAAGMSCLLRPKSISANATGAR